MISIENSIRLYFLLGIMFVNSWSWKRWICLLGSMESKTRICIWMILHLPESLFLWCWDWLVSTKHCDLGWICFHPKLRLICGKAHRWRFGFYWIFFVPNSISINNPNHRTCHYFLIQSIAWRKSLCIFFSILEQTDLPSILFFLIKHCFIQIFIILNSSYFST